MKVLHAIPAYGRDYKSKKEVQADWEAGKDFILTDVSSPWDGKAVNLQDARENGFTHANLRFKGLASLCVLAIKPEPVRTVKDDLNDLKKVQGIMTADAVIKHKQEN